MPLTQPCPSTQEADCTEQGEVWLGYEAVFIERGFEALGAPRGETTRRFALHDVRARGRVTKAAG